jgi:succinate-acetate transporter protein
MFAKTIMGANGVAFDASIDGWAWLCAFLVLVCLTPCYLKANKIFFWVVVLADVAVGALALTDLGIAKLGALAGWVLLAVGIGALYLVAATAINGTFGKTILPVPAPYSK